MSFGIDLGTQSCRVAIWKDGLPMIIPDGEGNRAIPSYVAFSKEGRRFGSLAKAHQGANIENTIYGVKQLLGRDLREAGVHRMVGRLPYNISSSGGTPVVEVSHLDRREKLALEEITAMQISKLQRIVEAETGLPVKHPVIAIPPGFSRHQRQAVVDACDIAGLPSPHLIDDTSAAALYYAFYSSAPSSQTSDSQSVEKNVLILNIGAGVTSASLVTFEDGLIEIKAASSNLNLGGGDFDEAISAHISHQLQLKNLVGSAIDPRTRSKLVSLAERARKELSSAKTSSIDLEAIVQNDRPFAMTITRDQVDLLCKNIYMDILSLMDHVVEKSGIMKSRIHEVVLVGGATRTSAIVPAIQSRLLDETPIHSIRNLDEAVALGSAIYGALKGPTVAAKLESMLLIECIHASLGVAILKDHSGNIPTLPADGGSLHEYAFQVVVSRNTSFPFKKTIDLSITGDGDRAAHVQVYEGESQQLASNNFLGSFELHDIPMIPAGLCQSEVTVTFEINMDRGVVVSVEDFTGRKRSMAIKVGRLSRRDKETMKAKALVLAEQDQVQEDRIHRRNEFEEYCYTARESIESLGSAVEDTLEWIHGSQVSPQSDVDLEQRKSALVQLVGKVLPPGFFVGRESGAR